MLVASDQAPSTFLDFAVFPLSRQKFSSLYGAEQGACAFLKIIKGVYKMKKFLLILTSCLLIYSLALPHVAAAEKAKVIAKDETVYATLSATGKQKNLYIVNSFEVGSGGIVTDFGEYSKIKNLTNANDIEQADHQITFSVDESKFYYQGTNDQLPLPWKFSIDYYLNGKKTSPEELLGQSGHVRIEVHVKENKDAERAFFENYVVQISVPLNVEVFSRIKAEDAILANVGKNKQATYTVMPEKEETYMIEADAEEFEMGNIEFSAMPFTMAFDLPDVDGMKDDMTTLVDAIDEIHNGVGQFNDGIGQLQGGLGQLKGGSDAYNNGIQQLHQSSNQLVNGSKQISDALLEMKDGLSALDDFEIPDIGELDQGFEFVLSFLQEVKNGINGVIDNQNEMKKQFNELIDSIVEVNITEEDWQKIAESGVDEEIINGLRAAYESAAQLKSLTKEMNQAFDQATEALGQISGHLTQSIEELEKYAQELASFLDGVDATEDVKEFQAGIQTFINQYGEFHQGLVQYTNGVSELANNYQGINQGIAETKNGVDGLQTGGNELYDGTKKLANATADLPDQMTEEIDQLLAEYDKSDFEPISFVSKKNQQIEVVQFVIKTEELKLETTEQPKVEDENKGLWQRFLDLFR